MTVEFTISNKSFFPGMEGLPSILDNDDVILDSIFESIYGNVNFSFNVNFVVRDDENNILDISAIELTQKPNFVSTSSVDSNSINLHKNNIKAFEIEEYNFSYHVDSEGIVEVTDDPEYLNSFISEWIPPSIVIKDVNYTFDITHKLDPISETNTITTIIIPQKVYWYYKPSLDLFEEYVNR